MIKKLIKEPLFHFLLIGLVFFLLYELTPNGEEATNEIVIKDSQLDHLISIWELQWNRPPTENELQSVIEQYVRQEVFYREALKMKLDQNDEVIKRRLAQKMEFLSDDLSELIDPVTDDKLQKYFEANHEKYQLPYRYSFHQLIFTFDQHDDPEAKAREVLKQYGKLPPEKIQEKGDRFALPFHYDRLSEPYLDKELGGKIVDHFPDLPLNRWSGPVESGYGYHLIYLTEKTEPKTPAFDEVKRQLALDYAYEAEKRNERVIYQSLKNNYKIVIAADVNARLKNRLLAKTDKK